MRDVCVCVRELTVNSLLNVWLAANKKSFRFTYMKKTKKKQKQKNNNSYCMHVTYHSNIIVIKPVQHLVFNSFVPVSCAVYTE